MACTRPDLRLAGISGGMHALIYLPGHGPSEHQMRSRAARKSIALHTLGRYWHNPPPSGPQAILVGYGTPAGHAYRPADVHDWWTSRQALLCSASSTSRYCFGESARPGHLWFGSRPAVASAVSAVLAAIPPFASTSGAAGLDGDVTAGLRGVLDFTAEERRAFVGGVRLGDFPAATTGRTSPPGARPVASKQASMVAPVSSEGRASRCQPATSRSTAGLTVPVPRVRA
jgi:hypothetical protein